MTLHKIPRRLIMWLFLTVLTINTSRNTAPMLAQASALGCLLYVDVFPKVLRKMNIQEKNALTIRPPHKWWPIDRFQKKWKGKI